MVSVVIVSKVTWPYDDGAIKACLMVSTEVDVQELLVDQPRRHLPAQS